MTIQIFANIFIVCIVILLELLTAYKYRKKWLLSIPTVLWMIHSLIFYFLKPFIENNMLINEWSQVLRTHGYITILSLNIYRYLHYRKPKKQRGKI